MNNLLLIKKAEETHSLSKDELTLLLEDSSINQELFDAADRVRKKYVGDEIHLRGLIEFSNICYRNCLYCGIRKDNSCVSRYRLEKEEIFSLVKKAVDFGYRTIVLQGGEDLYFSCEKLCEIIREIKKYDVALTLSIGERSFEEYEAFKKAGADRFLLRIETTDKELYERMHPKASFDNRVACLKNLKSLGFETGSGCLVGLPGQSDESLADDILFFKNINADMIGIGPLIVHPQTPLLGESNGSFEKALKVMALTRLLLPDINIPATTAMETIQEDGRLKALQSGANVVMPNIADVSLKKKYEIYPGKSGTNTSSVENKDLLLEKIEKIGRKVSKEQGFRKKS